MTIQSGPDPLIGSVVHDRYEIVRLIGTGGMGLVYEARHVLLERRVAFKTQPAMLAPEAVERFHREARAAAAIGNDHIVDVMDMGRLESGAYYMVMEYLDGVELSQAGLSGSAMSVRRAVHVACQLCEALASVHQAGIVHRDLKPENVFLIERKGDPDFVKVLDFGVCRVRSDDERRLTRSGDIVGTPQYMAPEQVEGRGHIDQRTDIYAIGAILYFLLTQNPPFDAEVLPQLFVNIHQQPAPSVAAFRPSVPAELDTIVQRLLQKAPEDRFADCNELRMALAPFLHHVEPAAGPVLVLPDGATHESEQYTETAVDVSVHVPRAPETTQSAQSLRSSRFSSRSGLFSSRSGLFSSRSGLFSSRSGLFSSRSGLFSSRSGVKLVAGGVLVPSLVAAAALFPLDSELESTAPQATAVKALHPSGVAPNNSAVPTATAAPTSDATADRSLQQQSGTPSESPATSLAAKDNPRATAAPEPETAPLQHAASSRKSLSVTPPRTEAVQPPDLPKEVPSKTKPPKSSAPPQPSPRQESSESAPGTLELRHVPL